MFQRNELAHLVMWPREAKAKVELVDEEGVVLSALPVDWPLKGSDIAKMVPEGFCIDPNGCTVVTMSGDILVSTVGEFDTAVVTERPEITFEQRMALLERRQQRSELREERLAAENQRLRDQVRAEMEQETEEEPVVDDEPDETPDPEPKPKKEEHPDET